MNFWLIVDMGITCDPQIQHGGGDRNQTWVGCLVKYIEQLCHCSKTCWKGRFVVDLRTAKNTGSLGWSQEESVSDQFRNCITSILPTCLWMNTACTMWEKWEILTSYSRAVWQPCPRVLASSIKLTPKIRSDGSQVGYSCHVHPDSPTGA